MHKTSQFTVYRCCAGRTLWAILCFTAAVFLLGGCSRTEKSYVMHPNMSVNVGTLTPGWPKDIEKLTKAEQDVLRTKGRPQMIHVWWQPNGDLIDRSAFFQRQHESENERSGDVKLSWVYLNSREEIVFPDPIHWQTQPISDKLRTVCEVGDPQEINYRALSGGERQEEWIYHNRGIIYRFVGDRLVETDKSTLPPIPGFMTR